mmetsp:Transcript_18537/g.40103  ORF Transcript_18537/g.40103 Transcript_18537/m.40103 type:complete len:797 (+) Transcript_18537:94-2484(+)
MLDSKDSDLNDMFATFRLPVPLAKRLRPSHIDADDASSPTANLPYPPPFCPSWCSNEWILQLIDLMRLIDKMKQLYTTSPVSNVSQQQQRTTKSQLILAQSNLATIERNFTPHLYEYQNQRMNTTSFANVNDENHNFYVRIGQLIETLQRDTHDLCAKHQDWLDRQQSIQHNNQMGVSGETRDLIEDIFLTSDEQFARMYPQKYEQQQPTYTELLGEFNDDVGEHSKGELEDINHDNKSHQPQQPIQRNRQPPTSRNDDIDPIEFQKQQQQLLEDELSSLATRLKSSTLAMNATLQTQTHDLEDMEQLAQSNLDSVSSTTKKVEDRLAKKRGWKKRLTTWSLVGSVIGMWVFCFLLMRTIPKRRIRTVKSFGGYRRRDEQKKSGWFGRREQGDRDDDGDLWERGDGMPFQREKQRQKQWIKHPHYPQQEQECEVLSDDTQICPDLNNNGDAYRGVNGKAHQMAAERKRRRIEERMANAPAVVAVDVSPKDDVFGDANDDEREITERIRMEEAAMQRHTEEENAKRKSEEDARLANKALIEEQRRVAKAQRVTDQEARRKEEEERANRERLEHEAQVALEEKDEMERERLQRDKVIEQQLAKQAKARAATEKSAMEEKRRLEAEATRLRMEREKRIAAEIATKESERLERERLEDQRLRDEEEKRCISRILEEAKSEASEVMKQAQQMDLKDSEFLASDVRFAAAREKNELLAQYISKEPEMIDASDASGWRPIHEAARGGNIVGVQLLINAGCDLTARTGRGGNGGTALWWATQRYGEDNDVVKLLKAHGAPNSGP